MADSTLLEADQGISGTTKPPIPHRTFWLGSQKQKNIGTIVRPWAASSRPSAIITPLAHHLHHYTKPPFEELFGFIFNPKRNARSDSESPSNRKHSHRHENDPNTRL